MTGQTQIRWIIDEDNYDGFAKAVRPVAKSVVKLICGFRRPAKAFTEFSEMVEWLIERSWVAYSEDDADDVEWVNDVSELLLFFSEETERLKTDADTRMRFAEWSANRFVASINEKHADTGSDAPELETMPAS